MSNLGEAAANLRQAATCMEQASGMAGQSRDDREQQAGQVGGIRDEIAGAIGRLSGVIDASVDTDSIDGGAKAEAEEAAGLIARAADDVGVGNLKGRTQQWANETHEDSRVGGVDNEIRIIQAGIQGYLDQLAEVEGRFAAESERQGNRAGEAHDIKQQLEDAAALIQAAPGL